MAGVNDTLDLTGLGQWAEQSGRSLTGTSFAKPLKACQVAVVASTKENFAGSHEPDGTPWKPLAWPSPAGRTDGKPLHASGLLMASLSARGTGQGAIREITDTEMIFGTNLDYAEIHQKGGTIKPKGKALAIPLTKEASRTSGPRSGARPWTAAYPDRQLFAWTSASGKGFLAEAVQKGRGAKQGRGQHTQIILHYLFASSVTIPARPYLGFNEQLTDTCLQIIGEFIGEKFAR